MSTLASYTILVQNEVDDTSLRAKSVIERAVKDTYQEIVRLTGKNLIGTVEEDITATIGQRYVSPTTAFQDITNVLWKNSDNYNKLPRVTEEDYYAEKVNRDNGDPTGFYLNGTNIYFDLAPSVAGTVKVSGLVVQDELVGSVVSVVPDRFTQVVLLGSIARFKAYEGVQDANEYFKMYRGPYFEQGRTGGTLKTMIDELGSHQPINKPNLWGK